MATTRAFIMPLAGALRAEASPVLRTRVAPMLKTPPLRTLRLQATPKRMMPMPKEEHSAHTISQRIRTLKKIPPELIPLGIVLAVALTAALYSLLHQFWSDRTLRLYRQGKRAEPGAKVDR